MIPCPPTPRSATTALRRGMLPAAALLLATACGETLAPEPPVEQPVVSAPYDVVTLGTMGGRMSNAWAVNTQGLIVGWSDVAGGRAVRWTQPGGAVDLTGLPSGTRGINEAGAITGYYNLPGGGQRGFVVDPDGTRSDLLPLTPGQSTAGYGINAAGSVVGGSGGLYVVWDRAEDGSYGLPLGIGTRTGAGGSALNDAGDVVYTTVVQGRTAPVLRRRLANGGFGPGTVLGTPAGGYHEAQGMNDAGVVVGYRWSGVIEVALAWHPSDYETPLELGEGQAWAVNAAGRIVGVTGGDLPVFGGGTPRRPALWTVSPERAVMGPFDLGTPAGYPWAGARGISANGWIVGSSWGPGTDVVATLWRPAS